MDEKPRNKISLVIQKHGIDPAYVSDFLNIFPSEVRTKFPKKSIAPPIWRTELKLVSTSVDDVFQQLIERIRPAKERLLVICNQLEITPVFVITIYSNYENRPMFSISPITISFVADLHAKITVDLEPVYDIRVNK